MDAWLKKNSRTATALLALAAAVSLASGIFWKAYAHDRVASTAETISRRTVADSLAGVRQDIAHNSARLNAQALHLHRIDSTSAKTCEDISLVKDILIAIYPRRYEEIKKVRDLKK